MTDYTGILADRLDRSIAAKQAIRADPDLLGQIDKIASTLVTCVAGGGTVFFCGNGGSSTDAQHLSAELLGRFYRDRPALPSVCLSDNVAAMTAIANDYSYAEVFSRQLSGLGKPGDVVVGLSTSGNSENVVAAVLWANANGLGSVGFTGASGGRLADAAQLAFRAPSTDTPRIQECHLHVGHTLCEIVEDVLAGEKVPTGV